MWNRSLVEYPTCALCDAGEIEDAKHLIYDCIAFHEERKDWRKMCMELEHSEFTLLESVMFRDKELLLKVCKLASTILVKRFKGNLDFWPKKEDKLEEEEETKSNSDNEVVPEGQQVGRVD